MSDHLVRLAVLLLRPVEAYHAWVWRRAYRKGRFVRPGTEKPCVTTRRRDDAL